MAEAFAFFALSTAVSGFISFLFPAEGPRLKDLTVSASTYGNPIPQVWGTCRVGGNMIWSSGIKEHKHKQKAGIGQYSNQYTYTADFAMAFCKGPVQSVRRIWANGKLIYDATGASRDVNNGKYSVEFFQGTEDQLPAPVIASDLGPNAPAYRGTCYAVFNDFLLSDFGNQIPQIAAEVYVGPDSTIPVVIMSVDSAIPIPTSILVNTTSMAVDTERATSTRARQVKTPLSA